MKTAFGKLIYDSLEELVFPDHTALVVVDMQNDLVSKEGFLAQEGQDVGGNRSIIAPLQGLIESARNVHIPIIYVQYTIDRERTYATPAWIYRPQQWTKRHGQRRVSLEACFEGTWGWEVIPELKPEPGDIIIRKNHLGAFWDTNLDKILRGNGIKGVVVTGTATSGCVLDTAVGAAAHDYFTVIVKDAVATNDLEAHELGLKFLMERYDSPSSEEVVTAWALGG